METFCAHQRLFPETGYAYAFVINAGHAFNAEAASFIYGLNAIMTGSKPTIPPGAIIFGLPFGLIADHILAVLTILVLTIGIVGSLRADSWAEKWTDQSYLRTVLHLLPYVLLSTGLVLLPGLMSTVNQGVSPSLGDLFSVWPPLVIFFAAASISGIFVIVLRVIHIASVKRRCR